MVHVESLGYLGSSALLYPGQGSRSDACIGLTGDIQGQCTRNEMRYSMPDYVPWAEVQRRQSAMTANEAGGPASLSWWAKNWAYPVAGAVALGVVLKLTVFKKK